MNRVRMASLAVLLSAGAVALAACSTGASGSAEPANSSNVSLASSLHYLNGTAKQNKAPANTGDFFPGARNDPAATKWVELTKGKAGDLNPVVKNGAGFLFYRFDKDSPNPPTSNCNGACAMTWPPALVKPGSKVFLNGVPASKVGVIKRADGTLQLTIGNWPIYTFSGDTNPGDTKGEGVGGTWFAVTPTGGKSLPPGGLATTPPATSGGSGSVNNSGSGSSSGSASGSASGDTIVTLFDDANFADNGSQQLSGSTGCQNVGRADIASSLQLSGAPIKIWTGKDCTGTSQVVTTGISDLSNVGFDNAIESIRFGVPVSTGTSTGTGSTTTTDAPPANNSGSGSATGGVTLGNGSAILDTGTNFSEPNGSFGVSGPGCQDVRGGDLVQSIQLAGGPVKLWTGAGCTGTSTVISSSVADLSTINFAGKLASIRFGDN